MDPESTLVFIQPLVDLLIRTRTAKSSWIRRKEVDAGEKNIKDRFRRLENDWETILGVKFYITECQILSRENIFRSVTFIIS